VIKLSYREFDSFINAYHLTSLATNPGEHSYIIDNDGLVNLQDYKDSIKRIFKTNPGLNGILLNDFDFFSGTDIQLFTDLKITFSALKLYLKIGESKASITLALMPLKLGFDGLICTKAFAAKKSFRIEIEKNNPIPGITDTPYSKDIKTLRKQIDEIDKELILLLARRLEYVKSLAEIKSGAQIPIIQPDRWKEVLDDAIKQGKQKGLSEAFVLQVFNAIHLEAVKTHIKVINPTLKD
jgi:chorismate mutase